MGNALSQEATIRKCRIVRTLEAVLQCVRLDAWSVVAVPLCGNLGYEG